MRLKEEQPFPSYFSLGERQHGLLILRSTNISKNNFTDLNLGEDFCMLIFYDFSDT